MPTLTATTSVANILKNLLQDGPALQLVNGLIVTPGPNSISFTFQTRFPSAPLIEIFKYKNSDYTKDLTPTNLVTSNESQLIGVARKKKHNYRLPESANWIPTSYPGFSDPLLAPLDQDTHYWFRVTADSAFSDVVPAVTIGRFWTSKRDVTVTMPELIVYQYGSSDIGNDVENAINSVASLFGASPPEVDYSLSLTIGLYDQVNGLVDQTSKGFDSANNNDDLEFPFANIALQCPGAHDFLWLFSHGQGNAGAWNIGPFQGVYELPPTPNSPSHGDYSGPWAEAAIMSPPLPDTPAELSNPIKLILDSGPEGTDYQIVIWMNVTLTPARHAPIIYSSPVEKLTGNLGHLVVEKLQAQKMKKMTANDEGALALGTPKKLHIFVPGAKQTLWSQTRDITSREKQIDKSWNKLAEGISMPLAVLENDDGSIDLVGRGSNGHAWHTNWEGTDTAKRKWHDLGKPMNEEIALIREGTALDIFMLSDDGAVLHGHLADQAKSAAWKSIGGKISTGLKAISISKGEIFLFGLGKTGNVWHNTHSASEKSDWTPFGSSDNIQLTVLTDEKHIVLFAINKDRSVSRKSWNGKTWSPSADEWTELGNLDSLFGPPPSAK